MLGILERQWKEKNLKLNFYDILPSDKNYDQIPSDVFHKIVRHYEP